MNPQTFSGLIIKPRLGTDYVRGLNSPIPYLVRLVDGDWRPYLPTYFGQKFLGFDTSCCWAYAGCVDVAAQLNFLKAKGQFPLAALKWFQDNGYFDSNGSFALSERFIAIISGVRDTGNDHIEFWRLSRLNGILPRQDLSYSDAQASKWARQEDFADDYFNPTTITPKMRQKALDSRKYVNLAYEWIGQEFTQPSQKEFEVTLKQSPIQVGVPVCYETWNTGTVISCGIKDPAHSVSIVNLEASGIKDFRDHYHPENKTFSSDYPVIMATHGVVTPILNQPYIPPITAQPYPKGILVKIFEEIYKWLQQQRLKWA